MPEEANGGLAEEPHGKPEPPPREPNASNRFWGGFPGISANLKRILATFIIFSVKIILAALLLAVDLALTELAGIALGEESRLYAIAKFLFQLAFFGVAVIMVTVGAVIVAVETVKSGYEYLKGDSDK